MARGGMSNRRGPTLAERSAAARGSTPTEATSESPADDRTAYVGSPRQRHCWVHAPEAPSEPLPGLVVEWRRSATGWEARVVYALDETDPSTIVEAWIPAQRLRPA
jgi:formylglycine-generating enzyme required for sulfatase activity